MAQEHSHTRFWCLHPRLIRLYSSKKNQFLFFINGPVSSILLWYYKWTKAFLSLCTKTQEPFVCPVSSFFFLWLNYNQRPNEVGQWRRIKALATLTVQVLQPRQVCHREPWSSSLPPWALEFLAVSALRPVVWESLHDIFKTLPMCDLTVSKWNRRTGCSLLTPCRCPHPHTSVGGYGVLTVCLQCASRKDVDWTLTKMMIHLD